MHILSAQVAREEKENVIPVVSLDLQTVIGNALTIYLNTNHQMYVGRVTASDNFMTDLVNLAQSNMITALAALKGSESVELRAALRSASETLRRLLTDPLQPADVENDYGSSVMNILRTGEMITTTRPVMKALSVPIELVSLASWPPAESCRPGIVPSPTDDVSIAFGRILAIIDLCKATEKVLPLLNKSEAARTAAVRPIEEIGTYIAALEDTLGVGALYACQLPAFIAAASSMAVKHLADMTLLFSSNLRGRIARLTDSHKDVLDVVPLHGILRVALSWIHGLTVRSRYNQVPAPAMVIQRDGFTGPNVLQEYIEVLQVYYGASRVSRRWGEDAQTGSGEPADVELTYPQFLGMVRSLGASATQRWPVIAKELGWPAAPTQVCLLDLTVPPILVTDGDKYSANPAILGLGLCEAIPANHEVEQSLGVYSLPNPACGDDDWMSYTFGCVKGRYASTNAWQHIASVKVGHAWLGDTKSIRKAWPGTSIAGTALITADELTEASEFFSTLNPSYLVGHPDMTQADWDLGLSRAIEVSDAAGTLSTTGDEIFDTSSLYALANTSDFADSQTIMAAMSVDDEVASLGMLMARDEPHAMTFPLALQAAQCVAAYLWTASGSLLAVQRPSGILSTGPSLDINVEATALELARNALTSETLRKSTGASEDLMKVYDVFGRAVGGKKE